MLQCCVRRSALSTHPLILRPMLPLPDSAPCLSLCRSAAALSGHFACVVATAGALHNLLNTQQMHLGLFSAIVLDECHHATGVSHRDT